ncbi:uncharacterized protein A4U43_C05F9980 [Asparagus officinalis]|uniref:Uncharacterized protein n=1 Tax=Asparagus officinalis TaxID=4686 RepID=A0A5P1EUA5_ASPOF|nr:uncharacterized protein A4U43_C05F9980 [Asparagus officinalis]
MKNKAEERKFLPVNLQWTFEQGNFVNSWGFKVSNTYYSLWTVSKSLFRFAYDSSSIKLDPKVVQFLFYLKQKQFGLGLNFTVCLNIKVYLGLCVINRSSTKLDPNVVQFPFSLETETI